MKPTPPWTEPLRAPRPCDHVVQLYTNVDFLATTVAYFLGGGFADGEAAIVIATPSHVALFTERLTTDGLVVPDLMERGQLVMVDAERCLAEFMVDGKPDRAAFSRTIGAELERVRAAGYAKIRLYGEMVDILRKDDIDATLELEELWNALLPEHGVSLLCAYGVDNFDRFAHRRLLHRVSRAHSHLIPVEDYERLAHAVDRAYADVFGADGDAERLRDLLTARYPAAAAMPPAEAALFALRDIGGSLADDVLKRAGRYYRANSSV